MRRFLLIFFFFYVLQSRSVVGSPFVMASPLVAVTTPYNLLHRYEGQFDGGKCHGRGTYFYANGNR